MNYVIVGKSFSIRFSGRIVMAVLVGQTVQKAAERIVWLAKHKAKKVAVGSFFTITNTGDSSCHSDMATLLCITAINTAPTIRHSSSCLGVHNFKRIR